MVWTDEDFLGAERGQILGPLVLGKESQIPFSRQSLISMPHMGRKPQRSKDTVIMFFPCGYTFSGHILVMDHRNSL